jgi:cell division protein FtsB
MAVLRQREEAVRLLGRRFLLVALGLVAIFGTVGVWNIYQKSRESKILATEAQMQAKDLSDREAELKKDIADLQTDRGREEALRKQYAMAASGEGVIILVEAPAQQAPTASSSAFVQWLHKAFPWW